MKKEILLLNNKDLNISDFDKTLSYDALSGIISAKRSYEKAKNSNDSVGMAKANAYANSIRKQHGGYSGGDDGSAYYTIGTTKRKKPEYTNKYSDEIDSLYNKIKNRKEFSYNPETDPMYQLYKKVYQQFGETAYERALSENAARTGGIASTNAVTAANQAQAYYKTQLAEKAMDLYKSAYSKYISEGDEMRNDLNLLANAEDRAYKRYRDDMSDYEFGTKMDYDTMRDIENDIREEVRYEAERAYDRKRDAIRDYQWQQDYNLSKEKSDAETARWKDMDETDKLNAVAKLVGTLSNKSNTGAYRYSLQSLLNIATQP